VDRRTFLGNLTGGLLAAPLAAEAQPAGKVYRIGVLAGVPTPPVQDAFLQGLRERGYVEGKNLALDWRWSMGQPGRFPELAAELVSLKVDLIVVVTNESARAAKQATATIPIVIGSSSTPDRVGLVASLARPGGNVTGLTIDTGPEMASKMLQLLKESAPKASLVAVILEANPVFTFHPWADQPGRLARDIEAAGHGLGLTLHSVPVRGATELPDAFTAIISARAEALLVDTSGLAFVHRRAIVEFAAKHRLPAIYAFRQFPEDGGLMAYGVDLRDLYRRAAGYVDKIFKGAKPADLPVEQPTKFELIINLKTAKALGLTIPPSLLQRADQVIE
jgi:ABC-type uncharacterized transport system substrate-binding protein